MGCIGCGVLPNPVPLMTDKPTPIRNRRVKSLGFYRQPDTEFVTPRLNKERGFIQAVGFTARGDYDCECYEDEDRKKR